MRQLSAIRMRRTNRIEQKRRKHWRSQPGCATKCSGALKTDSNPDRPGHGRSRHHFEQPSGSAGTTEVPDPDRPRYGQPFPSTGNSCYPTNTGVLSGRSRAKQRGYRTACGRAKRRARLHPGSIKYGRTRDSSGSGRAGCRSRMKWGWERRCPRG